MAAKKQSSDCLLHCSFRRRFAWGVAAAASISTFAIDGRRRRRRRRRCRRRCCPVNQVLKAGNGNFFWSGEERGEKIAKHTKNMCSEKPLSPPPPTAAAAVSTTAPLRKTEEVSSFFAFVPSPFGACARKSHRYYFQIVLCLAICQQHYGLAKWTFSRNFSILFGIFLPSKKRMKADFFQEKRAKVPH